MTPGFRSHPDPSEWDNYVDYESTSWPKKDRRRLLDHSLASASTASRRAASSPTSTRRRWTSARSKATRCTRAAADAPAPRASSRPNQLEDPDRILYPLRRTGERGEGEWERVTWDEALDRHRRAHPQGDRQEGRRNELMYHVGRPGEDGYANRVLQAWGVDGHNSHTNVCSSSARLGHFLWTRRRPAVARLRERADDPAAVVAPRDRPLLQPARAADHGGAVRAARR